MFGLNFYHAAIRKHIAVFGTLMNEINVMREAANGDVIQTIRVPLTYGPREKMLARVKDDPDLSKPYAMTVPRMSFEIKNLSYDSKRHLASTQKFSAKATGSANSYQSVYMPVPYNFEFELTALTKTADDGAHIVEQILPFFTPNWAVTVNLLDDVVYPLNLITTLESVENQDLYDGDFKERQIVTWTLGFNMEGYLFGPVHKSKIIKIADTNFITDWQNPSTPLENVHIIPGLTVDGQPTSNAALAVDPLTVQADDPYGYVITITDNPQ